MKVQRSNKYYGFIGVLLVFLLVSIGGVKPVFAAAPSNDDITGATVVASLPFTDSLNTAEATVEGSEPAYDCGWNVGKTVWYSYTPGLTGDVFINTQSTIFNTVINVFDASGMTPVACDATVHDSDLLFSATAGITYLISVGGYNGSSGDLNFNMVEPQAFTSCGSVDVTEEECDILEALYLATTGASWTDNSGWLATDVVCSWTGVVCKSGFVNRLMLVNNNLDGLLNVDFSSLTNFSQIDLGTNNLTGDMSTIIGNLPTGMYNIYLSGNGFTGTLPPGISSFTNLGALGIFNNSLSGDIADVFANLPNSIGYFAFGNNDFYGTIPAAASSLTNLYKLHGISNLMSGDIADVINNLPPSLSSLYLENNDFYGTIPPSISSLSSLDTLIIGNNELSGDFTSLINILPTGMKYLYLNGNNFTGRIPSDISNLSGFRNLKVDYNPLGGTIPISITGLSLYEFSFLNTFLCEPADGSYATWKAGVAIYNPGYCAPATSLLFEDDFETGDFSLWTRFNDGKGYLYPCMDAAINGTWGACVDRGTDKRKQLIDETPVFQDHYNVRFNFDINSLSMAAGTRFRFIQVKMGAERPFFIVLKYQGGQYLIQLNTLLDDYTKVKTGWYPLSDAPHVIEVDWIASLVPGADNGYAALFVDDEQLELLPSLDNDTIYVDTFKIGFTSRLDGKPISGIFYLDDIATANDGHIGLVEP